MYGGRILIEVQLQLPYLPISTVYHPQRRSFFMPNMPQGKSTTNNQALGIIGMHFIQIQTQQEADKIMGALK